MGFFIGKKSLGITPQGDLQSSSLIEAVYELDQDLTLVKDEVANTTSGNLVTQDTAPSSTSSLWIDTGEN